MGDPPAAAAAGRAYSSNTGPKGVLSDSQQAERDARAAQADAARELRAEQEARALTVPPAPPAPAPGSPTAELDLRMLDLSRLDLDALDLDPEERALLEALRAEQAELTGQAEPSADADADELAEWRAQRRAALQAGAVRSIDADEFLEVVEAEAAIIIYEEDVERCSRVLDQAGVILRRHPGASIVRITATELQFMTTDDGADDAVLPAVLVYKGGDLVAKHIRFEGDLEHILRAERLLIPSAQDERDDDL